MATSEVVVNDAPDTMWRTICSMSREKKTTNSSIRNRLVVVAGNTRLATR